MENNFENAIVPLNRKKQLLGILPTYSFWFGKTNAYHAVSPWFLSICGIFIFMGLFGLLFILGLESELASRLGMPISMVLTLGVLEKVVRKKNAHREQKSLVAKEGASAKRQLSP